MSSASDREGYHDAEMEPLVEKPSTQQHPTRAKTRPVKEELLDYKKGKRVAESNSLPTNPKKIKKKLQASEHSPETALILISRQRISSTSPEPSDLELEDDDRSELPPSPMGTGADLSSILRRANPSVSIVNAPLLWERVLGRRPPPASTQKVLVWFYSTVEAGMGIIPHQLKKDFQTTPCNYAGLPTGGDESPLDLTPDQLFPEHLYDAEHTVSPTSDQYASALRQFATDIVLKASKNQFWLGSENSWSSIVESIFNGPIDSDHSETEILKLLKTSDQPIDSSLLPVIQSNQHDEKAIQGARVDYMLGFDGEVEELFKFIGRYYDAQLNVFKSIGDHQRSISLIGIELKSYKGNYFDANYQSLVHSVSVLVLWNKLLQQARRKKKKPMGDTDTKVKIGKVSDLPPVPSIVVIGHDWTLHWTYWDRPGQIVHLGPYSMGSTASLLGTLKLLTVIGKLKQWAVHGIEEGDIGIWEMLKGMVKAGFEK